MALEKEPPKLCCKKVAYTLLWRQDDVGRGVRKQLGLILLTNIYVEKSCVMHIQKREGELEIQGSIMPLCVNTFNKTIRIHLKPTFHNVVFGTTVCPCFSASFPSSLSFQVAVRVIVHVSASSSTEKHYKTYCFPFSDIMKCLVKHIIEQVSKNCVFP